MLSESTKLQKRQQKHLAYFLLGQHVASQSIS